MNQEKLFQVSWRAARDVLRDLERGNFEHIEQKLHVIRRCIDLAQLVPFDSLHGSALFQREQMEVLSAVTDQLAGALPGIRRKTSRGLESLGANRSLLSHFVACGIGN